MKLMCTARPRGRVCTVCIKENLVLPIENWEKTNVEIRSSLRFNKF